MKRLHFIALAAALLPLPAAAQDLTATYREGNGNERHIEIAANGDLRSDLGMDSYLLSHDGVDYLVMPGPGGPLVLRADDIVAARAGHLRQAYPPSGTEPSSLGTVMVNGRSGIAYGYPPRGGVAQPPYLVVSNDPELAPIGRAFRRLHAIEGAIDTNFEPSPSDDTGTLIGTGAPIHILSLGDLVAVSHAPIPASRFALPAPPQPRDQTIHDFTPADAHDESADAGERRMIKRAVYAGGALWLLADNGVMTTIDASHKPAIVATPAGTRDLCRFNGSPVIVAGDSAQWTLQRWGGAGWEPWRTIAAHGEELVGLLCTGERYDLLTNRRLIEISAAGERAVALSGSIRPSLIASMYDDGAALFVGSDAGEFGGGLVRIDRASGRITSIEKRGPGLCSGPLNTACDPVNGIAPEPGKPDCLLVTVGLQHFMPSGHLAEICGERIVTFYAKPYTLDPDWHFDPGAPEPRESVPFYSLAASGDALWAVGTDGLYRIEAGGGIRFTKLPAFEKIGGVWVSFALPDMALVLTSINARKSIGGPAILLVPE